MNFQDLFCGRLYLYVDTERIFLDLTELRNLLQKVSDGVGDRFVLANLVTIYTRFRSSQPPVSLETTTTASLTREISAIIPK